MILCRMFLASSTVVETGVHQHRNGGNMDLSNAAAFKAADPLRSYILVLREGQHMSQPAVAAAAGIKTRTYIAWENGEVGKLDVEVARDIVRALGGLFEHVDRILDMTAEQAREMAHNWLSLSAEERAVAASGRDKLERIVALKADDPYALDDVLRRVRDAARADPDVLNLVSGYLAGLTSRSPRGE
jgi:DNA-binding XRE family transcriptional regulator